MIRAILIPAALVALACSGTERNARDSTPENPAPPASERLADAASASPDHYRTLAEAPGARLLLASWGPGESDRPHSHPTALWYALTPMRLRIEHSDGKTLSRTLEIGDSGVQPPIAGHTITNLGDREARLVMFEILSRREGRPTRERAGAPTAISIDNEFQLLQAHGGYRLVHVTLTPSDESGSHSHSAGLWLALTDARLLFRGSPGEERELGLGEGEALAQAAVRLHTVRNIGPHEARFLILETP